MPESTSDSAQVVREQSESVAATNLKVLGDGPAYYTNLSYGNAVANQQGMNQISAAIIGKVAEAIIETHPAARGSEIAALQQLMKGANLTPPVTGQ